MIVSSDVAAIGRLAQKNKFYVALGYFDGVHQGHQALLEHCLKLAQENQGQPCVLLLEPHPLLVLKGEAALLNLNTLAQRIALIQRQGDFNIFILPFTKAFAQLSPTEFVCNYLVELLQVGGVVSGFNYSFGSRGAGHSRELSLLGQQFGFLVDQVAPVEVGGQVVSSTLVRQSIEAGAMAQAAVYLGHPHIFMGRVVSGSQLGGSLGFPTANVEMEPGLLWPAYGVYGAWIQDELGNLHQAVVNVGIRPTLKQMKKQPSFEAHLLNFAGNLYNSQMQIILTDRLRPEQTFASLDQLQKQVFQDKQSALRLLEQLDQQMGKQGQNIQDYFFTCNPSSDWI